MNVSRVVRACVDSYVHENRLVNMRRTLSEPVTFTTADIVKTYGLDDLGNYRNSTIGEQAVRNAMAEAIKNGDVISVGLAGRYITYRAALMHEDSSTGDE